MSTCLLPQICGESGAYQGGAYFDPPHPALALQVSISSQVQAPHQSGFDQASIEWPGKYGYDENEKSRHPARA